MFKRQMMAALGLAMFFCLTASAEESAKTPTTIQPLLIGASIPSVSLTTTDGTTVDLVEAIKDKPSILVFYRGGW